MTNDQRFSILILLITLFFGTGLGFIIRASMRWARVEIRLDEVCADVSLLTSNKDKVHSEMVENMSLVHRDISNQMREDRAATNQRLRWLEENVWKGGNSAVRSA